MANQRSSNFVDEHVGQRIRLRRNQLKMSQTDLGDALGVTFQQVQKYENGTNRVGASRLWKVSEVLRTNVAWFFEGLNTAVDHEASTDENNPFNALMNSPDGYKFAEALQSIEPGALRKQLLEMARALGKD